MPFKTLGLTEPVLSAIAAEGYETPTQIQQQAIPALLEGKDMLGCAQTGTGKTAAFSLPIIQRLLSHPVPHKKQADRHERPIRSLILSPTRELAVQIGESVKAYSAGADLKHVVIYGGVRQKAQTRKLREGVDIVIATPGRLIDLISQGHVDLKSLEIFVLDEADRMLDMGFVDDIWHILSFVPKKRQSLLFSATMPAKIKSLADAILYKPVNVHIAPEMPAADTIEQRLYMVEWNDKTKLLEHILSEETVTRALIFTQTKRRADMVARELKASGMKVDIIHSGRPMGARKRALENFKSGKKPILIASDIAARGLDVDDLSHVVNYELPQEPEVYIHRIGRTGRAGVKGVAMSFCSFEEHMLLGDIEKLLGKPIPTIEEHPYKSTKPRLGSLAQKQAEKPKPTGVLSYRRPTRRRRL